MSHSKSIAIPNPPGADLDAIIDLPDKTDRIILLSHGAGAGMEHLFMTRLVKELNDVGIGTIRFNFPYITRGSKRPDHPTVAKKAIANAIEYLQSNFPAHSLFIGGKSFGGRMMSLYLAENDTEIIKGLIFYGFPLHPPGKDGIERAKHLENITTPMLFLQGSRDRLADSGLIHTVADSLPLATIQMVEGADHSFKMLKRMGISQDQAIRSLAEKSKEWMEMIIHAE